MHSNPIFIGLDIGTSSCKAMAIDTNAQLLGSAAVEYPCYAPQAGWSEQHASDWWEGTQAALQKLLSTLDISRIAGLGLSGQMHGMVALDAALQPLRPAILWNDQRTAAQCAEITEKAGGEAGLLGMTNNPMLTGFTAGKILWFRENEPELFVKTKYVVNPKDYIRLLLTGELAMDVSDASGTGLFDVRNHCFSSVLLERLALPASLFPQVLESADLAGEVTAQAAALTGLPCGLPIVAGGGDAVLSALGMGLGGASQVAVTLGTSGVVARHCASFFVNEGAKLQFSRACLPGLFHIMGVTLSAAGSYQWHESMLGDARLPTRGERYKALDAEAAQSPPGANGVLFLPYLSGERCPLNDPGAKGAYFGLRSSTTRGDLNRAVMEGVAFSLRQVYALMAASTGTAERLVLAGGGAVSPLWRQIVADIFGLPAVTLEASEEGSGFGAALLAALGLGAIESAEAAAAKLRQKTETLPQVQNASVYAERFAQYCALYPALRAEKGKESIA
ncbi:MAG: xylulokinase [Oscillospiraceae bacterium]|jgi:xylulokinase|nr:xylulokinase [Oscillospiraceae bacterium]